MGSIRPVSVIYRMGTCHIYQPIYFSIGYEHEQRATRSRSSTAFESEVRSMFFSVLVV